MEFGYGCNCRRGGNSSATVGDYLLLRLKRIGVKHIFGVPGDYNLEFLDRIVNQEGFSWVGSCSERERVLRRRV